MKWGGVLVKDQEPGRLIDGRKSVDIWVQIWTLNVEIRILLIKILLISFEMFPQANQEDANETFVL